MVAVGAAQGGQLGFGRLQVSEVVVVAGAAAAAASQNLEYIKNCG